MRKYRDQEAMRDNVNNAFGSTRKSGYNTRHKVETWNDDVSCCVFQHYTFFHVFGLGRRSHPNVFKPPSFDCKCTKMCLGQSACSPVLKIISRFLSVTFLNIVFE